MDEIHLSPTELGRRLGMTRREVLEACMEMGVPILQGRIDQTLFIGSLTAGQAWLDVPTDASTWILMDSTGNLLDSFTVRSEAIKALQELYRADDANRLHVSLIAYDSEGEPVEPRGPRSRTGLVS